MPRGVLSVSATIAPFNETFSSAHYSD